MHKTVFDCDFSYERLIVSPGNNNGLVFLVYFFFLTSAVQIFTTRFTIVFPWNSHFSVSIEVHFYSHDNIQISLIVICCIQVLFTFLSATSSLADFCSFVTFKSAHSAHMHSKSQHSIIFCSLLSIMVDWLYYTYTLIKFHSNCNSK